MNKHVGSGTLPIFEKNAEEIATRLEADGRPPALLLAVRARDLATVFKGWRDERPDDETRVRAISSLFDVTRRAMDLLAAKAR